MSSKVIINLLNSNCPIMKKKKIAQWNHSIVEVGSKLVTVAQFEYELKSSVLSNFVNF